MKKVFKWIGIVVGGLVVLLVIVLAGMYISTEMRLNKTYAIQPEALAIPTDAASIERGQTLGKLALHRLPWRGPGRWPFLEDPAIGYVGAANLTPGEGGIGGSYTDADWVRTLRHGVKPNGQSVFIMPSDDYYHLSDEDLGAMTAYLKTVSPVDRVIRAARSRRWPKCCMPWVRLETCYRRKRLLTTCARR